MQVAVYLDVNRVCLIGQGFNRASCLAGKWYFKHTEIFICIIDNFGKVVYIVAMQFTTLNIHI
jgi:hypothetical protein